MPGYFQPFFGQNDFDEGFFSSIRRSIPDPIFGQLSNGLAGIQGSQTLDILPYAWFRPGSIRFASPAINILPSRSGVFSENRSDLPSPASILPNFFVPRTPAGGASYGAPGSFPSFRNAYSDWPPGPRISRSADFPPNLVSSARRVLAASFLPEADYPIDLNELTDHGRSGEEGGTGHFGPRTAEYERPMSAPPVPAPGILGVAPDVDPSLRNSQISQYPPNLSDAGEKQEISPALSGAPSSKAPQIPGFGKPDGPGSVPGIVGGTAFTGFGIADGNPIETAIGLGIAGGLGLGAAGQYIYNHWIHPSNIEPVQNAVPPDQKAPSAGGSTDNAPSGSADSKTPILAPGQAGAAPDSVKGKAPSDTAEPGKNPPDPKKAKAPGSQGSQPITDAATPQNQLPQEPKSGPPPNAQDHPQASPHFPRHFRVCGARPPRAAPLQKPFPQWGGHGGLPHFKEQGGLLPRTASAEDKWFRNDIMTQSIFGSFKYQTRGCLRGPPHFSAEVQR
jgi:hypothetical protein